MSCKLFSAYPSLQTTGNKGRTAVRLYELPQTINLGCQTHHHFIIFAA